MGETQIHGHHPDLEEVPPVGLRVQEFREHVSTHIPTREVHQSVEALRVGWLQLFDLVSKEHLVQAAQGDPLRSPEIA